MDFFLSSRPMIFPPPTWPRSHILVTFSCRCMFLSCIPKFLRSVTSTTFFFLRPKERTQVFLIPERDASVKRSDAVLENANLSSSCFIVVRYSGTAHRCICCPPASQKSRRWRPSIFHKHVFQGFARLSPVYIQSTLWDCPLPSDSEVLI